MSPSITTLTSNELYKTTTKHYFKAYEHMKPIIDPTISYKHCGCGFS